MGQSISFRDHSLSIREDRPSSIDVLSDEDIYATIAERSDENAIGFRGDNGQFTRDSLVYPISDDAVFKFACDPEVYAMTYVASHTSIPIPRVRRVLIPRSSTAKEYDKWVVMDRIDGEPLETAWPAMSWWARLRVIWYMRDYIHQLHSTPVPYPDKPGPFDSVNRRHRCMGLFFTTEGGEFQSYEQMADWYDHRRFDAMVMHYRKRNTIPRYPKFDRTQPLVICHMDLNMRNIMVDRAGIPWIIDWGEAGAYPAWLEYAKAAVWFGPYIPPYRHVPWLWKWLTSFMFGNYAVYLNKFLYPMGNTSIWNDDPYNYELDYFTRLGIEVD